MSTGKSVTSGQHRFATVPSAEIQRSSFDRSCGTKTTLDAGLLVPVFVDEALPGDTMNLRMHTFARLATPLHPIMDNLYLDSHFFAVPIRLLWDNWEKFNGSQVDPGDSTSFLVPEMLAPVTTGYTVNDVQAFLGVPIFAPELPHSALWTRAYHLIFNEWFRSQDLTDSVIVDTDDGPDDPADYKTLLRRGKRHDYFTSCLPFPQKGPAVSLPLGTTAPLVYTVDPTIAGTGEPSFLLDGFSKKLNKPTNASTLIQWDTSTGDADVANWDDPELAVDMSTGTGVADLSAATAATINQLREAFQIQKLYERDARGGTRYTEIIRSHFGVTSDDARLQRPEYLGGGSQVIGITPVAQTAIDSGGSPQGNLAAYGVSTGSNHTFTKSFTEHCVILGLVSVRADLNYQQGLNRMMSRRSRWDFYWPALAHIGEQAVLNKELYASKSVDTTADNATFGYQERFAEYRYKPSMITGMFHSDYGQSLDLWHLAQDFSTLPVLDNAFIEENPPVDRVIAVPSEPHILLDAYFEFKCARPMPTYGVPGLIDHF